MPEIHDNAIIFDKTECLRPKATFECGQVFRYGKASDTEYSITSGDKHAVIKEEGAHIIITTDDVPYFFGYFDSSTDYNLALAELRDKPLMDRAEKFGYGIRILKQDKFETLISFIISANNRIPRIKKTLERICENLGTDHGGYYGFPSPQTMAGQSELFYAELGCGYRAAYIIDTAKKIAAGFDLEALDSLPTDELLASLMTLKGVGPKVADCIALFAYARQDTFPVDTWVKKISKDIFGEDYPPQLIRKKLVALYGKNAGIAQQYLFYQKRETEGHFTKP